MVDVLSAIAVVQRARHEIGARDRGHARRA